LFVFVPDEILEYGGHDLVALLNLEFELCAFWRIRIGVHHVGEGSSLSKFLGGALEIIFAYRLPELQAGNGYHVSWHVGVDNFHNDRNELRSEEHTSELQSPCN